MEAIDNVKKMIEELKDKVRLSPMEATRLYEGMRNMGKGLSGDNFKEYLEALREGSNILIAKYVDPLLALRNKLVVPSVEQGRSSEMGSFDSRIRKRTEDDLDLVRDEYPFTYEGRRFCIFSEST